MSKKEKKKGKNKKAEKQLKREKNKAEKRVKPGKSKASAKALRKEIQRLTSELQARDDQLKALSSSQEPIVPLSESQVLAQRLADSSDAGSVSKRKKAWERHQYLRSRYEVHLEAGLEKSSARIGADKDLRQRYGKGAGYTEEQLDSILS